jgi:hypothetical protein
MMSLCLVLAGFVGAPAAPPTEGPGLPALPRGVVRSVRIGPVPLGMGTLVQQNQDVRSALSAFPQGGGKRMPVGVLLIGASVRSALEGVTDGPAKASASGMPVLVLIRVTRKQP